MVEPQTRGEHAASNFNGEIITLCYISVRLGLSPWGNINWCNSKKEIVHILEKEGDDEVS